MGTGVNDRVVDPNIQMRDAVHPNAHGVRKVTFAKQDMGQINLLGVEKGEFTNMFVGISFEEFSEDGEEDGSVGHEIFLPSFIWCASHTDMMLKTRA